MRCCCGLVIHAAPPVAAGCVCLLPCCLIACIRSVASGATHAQVGLSEDEFADLPYHLRRAALRGGAEGLLEAGFRSRGSAADQQPGRDSSSSAVQQQQQWGAEQEGARAPGVHGASWRRQYIFVAATMPAEGERSVGAELAARFPDATWLAGRQLHQSKRALQHSWRQVDDEHHRAHVLHVSLGVGLAAVQKAALLACMPRYFG